MSNGQNKNRTTSHQDTVNQALGKTNDGPQTGDLMKPPPAEAMVMIRNFENPAELTQVIRDDLASGGFEAAPQLMSLKEGQMIEGICEGNGPDAEFHDNDTGEVTYVKTWIIADPTGAVRVSILSSVQLDRKLLGFIGCPVKIARGKDANIAGTRKRMTEYQVWGPRLPGGRKRQWFDIPAEKRAELEIIERRALPAAGHTSNGAAAAAAPAEDRAAS